MNETKLPSATEYKNPSLESIVRKASKKIAPVWPLESFVAVNPYFGLADKTFENAALELAVAGDIQMTMPHSFYFQKMDDGKLKKEHLIQVLKKKGIDMKVDEFLGSLRKKDELPAEHARISLVVDIAGRFTNKDLNRLMLGRISAWAASYFDNGQAIWNTSNSNLSPFAAWKEEAAVDRTPELSGLKGFRNKIKALPAIPLEAANVALSKLGIHEESMDIYLHSLLIRVGGWSAYAARLDWDSELYGGKDGVVIEFLAILLCWELCLFECLEDQVDFTLLWQQAKTHFISGKFQKELNKKISQNLILQEAFDLSVQQNILQKFKGIESNPKQRYSQAKTQAIFCIDVRSEVFRRNLELVDNSIETLGFAGFFAFPINYVPLGHDSGEAQCPVLLKTGPTILEEIPDREANNQAVKSRVLHRHVNQVWKSFKSGAVSCFSFVSPMGLSYLPKLFTDSFGLTRTVPHPNDAGMSKKLSKQKRVSLLATNQANSVTGIPLEQQIVMAKNALKAMSLTDDFAELILIVGHGASTVNNPHATSYDCGACGGHSGEANAKVAAAVLNNKAVRDQLQKQNGAIPTNTVFLACLHDTTTDEVTIFNEYDIPKERSKSLDGLKEALQMAGNGARTERLLRFSGEKNSNRNNSLLARSKDWSQTRPEWGLAGCDAFVVAPREITQNMDFGGKSFLHSYDFKKDENFGVLELIMTAPMVVTSWISLQYFASTVDNRVYGSGNKTLHNVTSGIGVLEGFSGDLRVGLPFQAIHDGETYQHDPVKLNVIIQAPMEAMNGVLQKHKLVKDLCDNRWLNLLAMDELGKVTHNYSGNCSWERLEQIVA